MSRRFSQSDNLIAYTDTQIFEMVRSGALNTFPRDFWTGINAKDSAKDITKYLFEKLLKWSIDDIKTNPLSDIFYDNRLGSMLKNLFHGSIYEALLNAYPELEEWINNKFNKEIKEIKEKKERIIKDKIEHEPQIQYTDEELIEFLQDKAKELNRNPVMREMSNPEGGVYATRFKSWERALIAAELIEDIYKDVKVSQGEEYSIQIMFKDFVIENERLPTQIEVLDIISEGQLKTYFRSYKNLCEYLESEYSKEELIKILQVKKYKLGRLPFGRDMKIPRAIVFVDMFGSWSNSLKEAGLTDN